MNPNPSLVAIALCASPLAESSAENVLPKVRVSPSGFSKVYQANEAAVVRVLTSSTGPASAATGVVIGVDGEFAFAARHEPQSRVFVRTHDGKIRVANVTGHAQPFGLALGRIENFKNEPETPKVAVVDPRRPSSLPADAWFVVLGFDGAGRPSGHAGQAKGDHDLVQLGVPANPGSPVFSTEGHLVAIVFWTQRKESKAVRLHTLMAAYAQAPFTP